MELKISKARLTLNYRVHLLYVHIVNAIKFQRFKSMGSLRQSADYDGVENLGFTSNFAPA